MIGKVNMKGAVATFPKVVNLSTKYGKYILKKNFKTMELINLKSQQYMRLTIISPYNNKCLQRFM